jgi:DNA mismatch endonuclease, patch repair protein
VAKGWRSTHAGRHLSGRRAKDTGPELALRRAIHRAGGRFRLQRRIEHACTPDLVFPGARLAVFVDGCFWHSCPIHGRTRPWAGPNADLWERKLARTVERDAASTGIAVRAGWHVVRVWECEINQDEDAVATLVLRLRDELLWKRPPVPARFHELSSVGRGRRASARSPPPAKPAP